MRGVLGGSLLAFVLTGSAFAGTILYATGTTPVADDEGGHSRIYGYCVTDGGGFRGDGEPNVIIRTEGQYPRRLQVSKDGILYVAEVDRVEAFRIKSDGALERLPSTRVIDHSAPHDIAISEDGGTLYAPRRGSGRGLGLIAAYKIGADGFVFGANATEGKDDYDSCLKSGGGPRWESLVQTNGKLYVSLRNTKKQLRVYSLLDDGSFQQQNGTKEDNCAAGEQAFNPQDALGHVGGPRTFSIANDSLYVQSGSGRRLVRFPFDDGDRAGLFQQKPSKKDAAKLVPAADAARSAPNRLFDDLIVHNSAILGSVFARGRIDSFRLGVDCADGSNACVPKQRAKGTSENLVETPHRIRAFGDTLYVPGGDLDRVRAYRLSADGTIKGTEPFSETQEIKGSFPNDVVVVPTSGNCR